MTSDRRRLLQRLGGTGLFGLVVFTISFMLSFPFDRITEQIVAVAASRDLDLEVGSAGPAFGIGVALKDVKLSARTDPGKKPAWVMNIAQARIGVSPLAEMRGDIAYTIWLDALGGEVDADIQSTKALGLTKVNAKQLAMSDLPGIREAINLPLGGTLDVDLDLKTPQNRNAEANGALSWTWAGCVLGDGKEKLKVPGTLLAEGITLPKLRLNDFTGKINFEKGVGKLQNVQAKGPDGELHLEGEIRLSEIVALSYIDLYLRFKLSDALLKSSDKLQTMLQFADSAKRADGFYGFHVTGTLSRPGSFLPMKSSPFATAPGAPLGRPTPARPGLGGVPLPRPERIPVAPAAPPPPPPPPEGEATPSPPPPATGEPGSQESE